MTDFRSMFAPQGAAPAANPDFRSMFGPPQVEAPAQVDAPPQLRNYAAAEVPLEALSNVGTDAGGLMGALGEAAMNPGQTLKALGKLGVGTLQQFIPGQQRYESEVADPFYQKLFTDYGVTWDDQGNASFDKEQFKRRWAEKPLTSLLDVSAVTGAGGAALRAIPAAGRVANALETTSRVTNPLTLPVAAASTAVRKTISPGAPLAQSGAQVSRQQAVQHLAGEGVVPTAGQRTGSAAIQYAESELGGGAATAAHANTLEQFTRAALRRIGENAPRATHEVLTNAAQRIGNVFNTIRARYNINDPQLSIDVTRVAQGHTNLLGQASSPRVMTMAQEINSAGGRLSGARYQALRTEARLLAEQSNNPDVSRAYRDLIEAMDDGFERSVAASGRRQDITALRQARRQYRNLITLETAAGMAGANAASGLISPASLRSATKNMEGRRGFAQQRGDFATLARAGEEAITTMPQSGTAPRAALRNTAIIGGALLGGGTEGMMGALAGAAAPYVAGRAIMTPTAQRWLSNQQAARIPNAPPVVRGATRATVAASPRLDETAKQVEAMKQAEAVLSPKVMQHVRSTPAARKKLVAWIRAKRSGEGLEQATRGLAEAVAAETKRPDLVERIVEEISAASPQ